MEDMEVSEVMGDPQDYWLIYGDFHKWRIPPNGWFMKNPSMDAFGVPLF